MLLHLAPAVRRGAAGAGLLAVGLLALDLTPRAGDAAARSTQSGDTVFADDFESGSLERWDDRGRPERYHIDTIATRAHGGSRSLVISYPEGGDAGWLTHSFMPGYDSIYVSYWLKLQAGWRSGTKLMQLSGSRVDNRWSGAGKAGVCPNGTDYFNLTIGAEPYGNPGPTHFYTYYVGMPHTPNGLCYGSAGLGGGQTADYGPPSSLSPGNWHHVEFWVVLNAPGRRDLVQRFWVDGIQRGIWSGIAVRTTTDLRLNALTITNSIARGAPQAQQLWVDDVVILRRRPRREPA